MRRSKRAIAAKARDDAETFVDSNLASDDEEAPKGKKRKVAHGSTAKTVVKPKGKLSARAKLRFITEIPLELLAEVRVYQSSYGREVDLQGCR